LEPYSYWYDYRISKGYCKIVTDIDFAYWNEMRIRNGRLGTIFLLV